MDQHEKRVLAAASVVVACLSLFVTALAATCIDPGTGWPVNPWAWFVAPLVLANAGLAGWFGILQAEPRETASPPPGWHGRFCRAQGHRFVLGTLTIVRSDGTRAAVRSVRCQRCGVELDD
ncbi:hypothetical protein ATK17_1781 [Branchiibius hedensis]|uniref:Uncharacterized protein n=1 Tax=Branchiibius hedensis TaxID=672460 RepID=A0A2Y8ZW22_9MICO|nr:hypothetical protein AZH51_12165 [Branchiibius sp. NY16-3462-2]PWJ25646.1 hypothetical protein ATK17_1781 [Branchiibius hedensis]SSA34459.1 hypothetical protein SAMN04489750_1781 [Branchiibius hedensis]